MVPLHFLTPRFDLPVIPVNINCQGPPLTPLHRAWAFGEALRAPATRCRERIALVGTGGISHWPATPDSGKINEAWDRDFLDRWARNDRAALLRYTDERPIAKRGQGGFEIRTLHRVRRPRAARASMSTSTRRSRSSRSAARSRRCLIAQPRQEHRHAPSRRPLHRQPRGPSRDHDALCRKLADVPRRAAATSAASRCSRPAARACLAIRRRTSRSPTASATTRFVYLNVRMGRGPRAEAVTRSRRGAVAAVTKRTSRPLRAGAHRHHAADRREARPVFDAKHSNLHPLFNKSQADDARRRRPSPQLARELLRRAQDAARAGAPLLASAIRR